MANISQICKSGMAARTYALKCGGGIELKRIKVTTWRMTQSEHINNEKMVMKLIHNAQEDPSLLICSRMVITKPESKDITITHISTYDSMCCFKCDESRECTKATLKRR